MFFTKGVIGNSYTNNYFLSNIQGVAVNNTNPDSISGEVNSDTLSTKNRENSLINEKVSYSADDSIILNIIKQVMLFLQKVCPIVLALCMEILYLKMETKSSKQEL